MAKAAPIQTNFNAGKLSDRLEGRVDLAKYANGCKVLQNFIPQIQGPAEKRPGTRFVSTAYRGPDGSNPLSHVRLMPFQFSTDDAYILELTQFRMRFYRNSGTVLAAPAFSFDNSRVQTTLDHIDLLATRHYLAHNAGPYQITTTVTLPAGTSLATDYFIVNNVEKTLTFDDTEADNTTEQIDLGKQLRLNNPEDMDVAANAVTIVAGHGFDHGHGPVRLTTNLTLPAGLALATDYWIIKISDTIFQFSANASVVTPVAFTDVGTGDHFVDTSHGYSTEEGPFRLTEGGTLPNGLVEGTDYWIIKVSESVIQLSLTRGGAARAFSDDGSGAAHTLAPRSPPDAFQFGLSLTVDGVKIDITSQGTGTHTLTPSAGVVHELVTPYRGAQNPDDPATSEIFEIQFTQSADVMYLAHKLHPPMKLSRTGHTQWILEEIDFDKPPFLPDNLDGEINLYSSHESGTDRTVWAEDTGGDLLDGVGDTTAFFQATDVGRIIRIGGNPAIRYLPWIAAGTDPGAGGLRHNDGKLYETPGGGNNGTSPPIHDHVGQIESDGVNDWEFIHRFGGHVLITAFVDGGTVTVDIVSAISTGFVDNTAPDLTQNTASTPNWAFGAWDTGARGYPRTVTFYEDRLWWAGSFGNPQTMWASRTGDYENHESSDEDEGGLIFTLNTDQVNAIEWMSPGKVLAIGTSGGEFIASASSLEEALTAANVRVVRHSNYGSRAGVQPLRIEQVVLFIQRAGGRLRELVFDFDTDSFIAPDLSVLADDLFGKSVLTGAAFTKANAPRQMAFQQEPKRTIWMVLDSGELYSMTYDRTQQVVGWHTHVIGNISSWSVQSVAVIPHPDGDGDQVWFSVRTNIGVASPQHILILEKPWHDQRDLEDAFYVDSGLTYDEVATTSTPTGLDHLSTLTVQVLADGTRRDDEVVGGGTITISGAAANVIQVGIGYDAILQTMRFEAGGSDGTSQGKIKRITKFVVRLFQTGLGLRYGAEDDADLQDVPQDVAAESADLKDGDTPALAWPKGYEQAGRVLLKHSTPFPCTITAIMPQVVVQDR